MSRYNGTAELIQLLAVILFIVSIFIAAIAWQVYKYSDCKKVGHSTLYCVGGFLGGK